jgi:hypothetical protein
LGIVTDDDDDAAAAAAAFLPRALAKSLSPVPPPPCCDCVFVIGNTFERFSVGVVNVDENGDTVVVAAAAVTRRGIRTPRVPLFTATAAVRSCCFCSKIGGLLLLLGNDATPTTACGNTLMRELPFFVAAAAAVLAAMRAANCSRCRFTVSNSSRRYSDSSSGPSLSKSLASGGVPEAREFCMRKRRSDMTFATLIGTVGEVVVEEVQVMTGRDTGGEVVAEGDDEEGLITDGSSDGGDDEESGDDSVSGETFLSAGLP